MHSIRVLAVGEPLYKLETGTSFRQMFTKIQAYWKPQETQTRLRICPRRFMSSTQPHMLSLWQKYLCSGYSLCHLECQPLGRFFLFRLPGHLHSGQPRAASLTLKRAFPCKGSWSPHQLFSHCGESALFPPFHFCQATGLQRTWLIFHSFCLFVQQRSISRRHTINSTKENAY